MTLTQTLDQGGVRCEWEFPRHCFGSAKLTMRGDVTADLAPGTVVSYREDGRAVYAGTVIRCDFAGDNTTARIRPMSLALYRLGRA